MEGGHEGVDISIRTVGAWFLGLAIFAGLSHVMLWVGYAAWSQRQLALDVPPSTMFRVPRIPPEPRVLPNPVDSPGRPNELLRGPGEEFVEFRKREDAEMTRLGLTNRRTGEPDVPASALRTLANERGVSSSGAPPVAPHGSHAATVAARAPALQALSEEMPSESSGGTRSENWTQPDEAYSHAHMRRPED
jgi:hypothetical protein